MIFEMTTGAVNSLNGRLPVKTLGGIQASGEPSIRPPSVPGVTTNLYHNHAESKYVRFSCGCISSLENLWRGPRRSISVLLCHGVHSASNRGEFEIRQTSVTVVIDENAGLAKGYQRDQKLPKENTCPIQVSVYGVVHVKMVETFGDIQ